ncbi:hypothetical protein HDU67_005946 [Dinochytrium kinnereticum]|nr:hypothetical protein HDU67_005946 [Dinochytrium kinnereticum]
MYNCMQVMFSGFHNLIKTKNLIGLEDLLDEGPNLNYSAFVNTGYVDFWGSNVQLNEYGDLKE